jgi:hypothetical protein
VTSERLDLANREFQAGKTAFERGDYRQSVQLLERANALTEPGSKLGGEVQVWLVTAYEAAGQRSLALDLCRKVSVHPDYIARKQGKRLLYILEAPKLKMHSEWLTEIPDMSNITDSEEDTRFSASKFGSNTSPQRTEKPKSIVPEPVDLSQVNTEDKGMIWAAVGVAIAILAGLVFLS